MNVSVARIAAALAKTRTARVYDADEIAGDAMALARLTRAAWDAVSAQAPIASLASEAQSIAERYGAELVTDADPELFIFGLRFRDGSFSGPMRNIFAVM